MQTTKYMHLKVKFWIFRSICNRFPGATLSYLLGTALLHSPVLQNRHLYKCTPCYVSLMSFDHPRRAMDGYFITSIISHTMIGVFLFVLTDLRSPFLTTQFYFYIHTTDKLPMFLWWHRLPSSIFILIVYISPQNFWVFSFQAVLTQLTSALS